MYFFRFVNYLPDFVSLTTSEGTSVMKIKEHKISTPFLYRKQEKEHYLSYNDAADSNDIAFINKNNSYQNILITKWQKNLKRKKTWQPSHPSFQLFL